MDFNRAMLPVHSAVGAGAWAAVAQTLKFAVAAGEREVIPQPLHDKR